MFGNICENMNKHVLHDNHFLSLLRVKRENHWFFISYKSYVKKKGVMTNPAIMLKMKDCTQKSFRKNPLIFVM